MLAMKLVRLIEAHSEELSRGLAQQLRSAERTSDYRKIPSDDLRPAAADVYRNLGEWLLRKPEAEIAARFRAVAARRAAEGISMHQYVWALLLSRDHLWQFLRRECFVDSIFELHAQLELLQLPTSSSTAPSTTPSSDTKKPSSSPQKPATWPAREISPCRLG